jgi:hypothetical protein
MSHIEGREQDDSIPAIRPWQGVGLLILNVIHTDDDVVNPRCPPRACPRATRLL